MVLSNEDRGALERIIDNAITVYVPGWLPFFRNAENRRRMQYQNGDDVVFGFIWGSVMGAFLPSLLPKMLSGMYTQTDLEQVKDIVYNRSDEIRQRIFNFG
jgi:hypothetical protein